MKAFNGARGFAAGGGRSSNRKVPRGVIPADPPPPTPPPGGSETPEMIAFKDAFLASAEPTHPNALDDAQQREMVLLTNTLTARANCTHVAVQDGNWTASTTWLKVLDDTFEVPTAGAKIGIPQGVTVTMDNNTTTVYDYLRVDGAITFATNQNTQLFIDTIVCCCTSTWTQGTTGTPIGSAYTSTITFPDGGNLDPAVDKLLIGRGWITMGDVRVCGAEKNHWALTSQTLAASATTMTLDPIPTGWAEGDSLHITGTAFAGAWDRRDDVTAYQGEDVTISNITGTTITFTPALTHTHAVRNETGFTDLTYPIVNFSRNIVFQSPGGTAIHRRGHVMWMGQDTDVRWAASNRLGRTIKSNYIQNNDNATPAELVTLGASADATNDDARIDIRGSDIDWLPTSNVRGRYNWHHHRTGIEEGALFAEFVGLAAEDAPGWLYSHHQGNANFRKCVGRRFQGVGIMAEVGSEAGLWEDCFMAGLANAVSADPLKGAVPGDEKRFGPWGGDFGRFGSCFWLKGRVVAVTGCIAAGANGGFFWMSRDPVFSASLPNVNTTPEPRVFYGRKGGAGTVDSDKPIITQFKNCVGIGVTCGAAVIKANFSQEHELRTHLKDNTFWNVFIGMHFEYTAHYTVSNNRCLALTPRPSINNSTSYGLFQGSSVAWFNWNTNRVSGFVRGVKISTALLGRQDGVEVFNSEINAIFDNCYINREADVKNVEADVATTWTYIYRVRTNDDIVAATPVFTPSAEPVLSGLTTFRFVGALTDDFGVRTRQYTANSFTYSSLFSGAEAVLMLERYGYFTYSGNNYLLVPDLISMMLPMSGEIPIRYLTLPIRLSGVNVSSYTNNGALATRYTDAITAGTYAVYEDALGVGGIYEGL